MAALRARLSPDPAALPGVVARLEDQAIDAARLKLILNDLRRPAMKDGWPAARFPAALAEREVAERGCSGGDWDCQSTRRLLTNQNEENTSGNIAGSSSPPFGWATPVTSVRPAPFVRPSRFARTLAEYPVGFHGSFPPERL